MEPTDFITLTRWAQGALLAGDPSARVGSVCTDSRALRAGDLFFALKGERFDAHGFVSEAAQRGALGAVVETLGADVPSHFGLIQVPDVLQALQQVAAQYRQTLSLKVVAVTGSNGKTSTKDFTASVLSQRLVVTKTLGNFNNHIGLPLTLLRAAAGDQVGVFEIGMNHPGEIAPLAALARPDVGIITNIGIAHIEFMGSREAIAQEKGMLAEALSAHGHLIVCGDDPFCVAIAKRTQATALFCGLEQGDVRATELRQDFSGTTFVVHAGDKSVEVMLPVPGVHMVRNALLAVGAGLVFGLTLEECAAGLRELTLTKGRLEQKLIRGIRVLDDTYNANPDSMEAALQTLIQMPCTGRRIAVLGAMGELGVESEHGHRRVGEVAGELGVDVLLCVGEAAKLTAEAGRGAGVKEVHYAANTEAGVLGLRTLVRRGDVVLVKGSRSAGMERVVEGLQPV